MAAFPRDPGIQALCCEALCKLVQLPEHGPEIIDGGGIELVLDALRNHKTWIEVQKQGVAAAQKLTRVAPEECERRFAAAGGLELVMGTLAKYPGNAKLVEYGFAIVRSFVRQGEAVVHQIVDLGCIKTVLMGMQLNLAWSGVQELGCAILADLAWENIVLQENIILSDGITIVLKTQIAQMKAPGVQAMACAALQALACDNSAARESLGLKGAVEVITKALVSFPRDELVQAYGLAALQSMCVDNDKNRDDLLTFQGVGLAQTAVNLHQDSKKVKAFGEMLMDTLEPTRLR